MSARATEMGENRRRAESLRALRAMRSSPAAAPPPAPSRPAAQPLVERCDLCGTDLPEDHRHMLNLGDRSMLCVCEPCIAMKAGAADLRPVGVRTVWLESFDLPDELWASFQVPVGLAFFLRSGGLDRVVAMYPSPAGATECELELPDWERLVALNPVLADLEPDVEALVVNRMTEPHQHAIAPIDECYRLVGMIKSNWEGISGGTAIERSVPAFFDGLRAKAEQSKR